MPNTKKITTTARTNKTLYAIIRREADGYLLDNTTGNFASNPANPHIPLTENGVIKGLYELLENRAVWNDGLYTVAVYEQTGSNPSFLNDIALGIGSMFIKNDTEVVLEETTETIRNKTDKIQFDSSNYVKSIQQFVTGKVVAHQDNEIATFRTDLPQTVDDYWIGCGIQFTSGALKGQVRRIAGYVGNGSIIHTSAGFTSIPAGGDEFKIINE